MKKTIQFILNKPQLSENVGMSLRSIGCFGFENLSLVSPRKIWPNDKGIKSAKHFSSLVKKVKVYQSILMSTLSEALCNPQGITNILKF